MRKAAGIILITVGVLFLCVLISFVAVFGIRFFQFFLVPFIPIPELIPVAVSLLCFVVSAAFHITGGIFCLRRKYWRVCLASASFAVFVSVFLSGGLLRSRNVFTGWTDWVMLVAEVIAVIFILRTKKEWQEISDSVDGKVSYGG